MLEFMTVGFSFFVTCNGSLKDQYAEMKGLTSHQIFRLLFPLLEREKMVGGYVGYECNV